LFSIIAHDVKSPVYALRTLFSNAQRYNLPAEEVKGLIPEVIGELNNSINLMENLLQWAKSQMNTTVLHSQEVSIPKLAEEVIQPLNLQARTKEIDIQLEMDTDAKLFINKEMLAMVLRNLVSNAIKFTPKKGTITVGINDMQDCVEIYVQDTGIGMSNETLQKINGAEYYTTNGTAGENGTGLGLVLCREFLQKSNSSLHIESKPGDGSIFSFSLSK
jgi:signal transduction histidine kinase